MRALVQCQFIRNTWFSCRVHNDSNSRLSYHFVFFLSYHMGFTVYLAQVFSCTASNRQSRSVRTTNLQPKFQIFRVKFKLSVYISGYPISRLLAGSSTLFSYYLKYPCTLLLFSLSFPCQTPLSRSTVTVSFLLRDPSRLHPLSCSI